ncbi:MAG: hypothetical protein J6R82_01090 [Clostridia bacterium]|nr:hypothetical protein [Clostridia bacterium]
MSYDLNLYLKASPSLSREAFEKILAEFGLMGEMAPDFAPDLSATPLCAKISGLIDGDERNYLAVVDCTLSVTEADRVFTLPAPRRRLFEKKTAAPTLVAPCGSYCLTFACGMSSLELPFALLIASALAGEDGLLYDATEGKLALGSDITLLAKEALDMLRSTPEDRLYLHEFDEWI